MNVLHLQRTEQLHPRNEPVSKIPVIKIIRTLCPDSGILTIKGHVDELFKAGSIRLDVQVDPTRQQLKQLEALDIYGNLHMIDEKARTSLHEAIFIAVHNLRYELAADILKTLERHF